MLEVVAMVPVAAVLLVPDVSYVDVVPDVSLAVVLVLAVSLLYDSFFLQANAAVTRNAAIKINQRCFIVPPTNCYGPCKELHELLQPRGTAYD
jgi:hypothetical protein